MLDQTYPLRENQPLKDIFVNEHLGYRKTIMICTFASLI
jgi:hypothetical protein